MTPLLAILAGILLAHVIAWAEEGIECLIALRRVKR